MKWSWFDLNWLWLGLVNALDGRLTDSTSRFSATNFMWHATPPPQSQRHPAKLASVMKRRWRIVLVRSKGEVLGTVEAADAHAAEKVAAIQFALDKRLSAGGRKKLKVQGKLRLTLLRFWNAAPT